MTIVEEIDKRSNRPHRSKNIVDALKYAYDLEETPRNIGDAIKKSAGGSPTPTEGSGSRNPNGNDDTVNK